MLGMVGRTNGVHPFEPKFVGNVRSGTPAGLLLVDGHAAFRDLLAFVLELEPDLTVLAQAGTLAAARGALAGGPKFDVAVVDPRLPDGCGAGFVGDLRQKMPRARTLVLGDHLEARRRAEIVDAGAAAIVPKSARLAEVLKAIRDLHAGKHLLTPQEISEAARLAERARREGHEARRLIRRLTSRELDVLQALAEGLSDREISERLHVGVGTVRTHLTSVLAKLQARSRLQALVLATRHGLVTMDQPSKRD